MSTVKKSNNEEDIDCIEHKRSMSKNQNMEKNGFRFSKPFVKYSKVLCGGILSMITYYHVSNVG